MEKIENILANCIKELKSGKISLAECLNRYPAQRHELEPLLKLALNIQEPPEFQLDNSYKLKAKTQLLQQIRTAKQHKSQSFTDIFSFGIPAQFVWARVGVTVIIVVILLSSLAGGTAYAAQSSLPGDLLYPVKTTTEDMTVFLAGNSALKAELNLKFAQTRLNEMSKLADRDQERTALAVNGYQDNLEAARQHIRIVTDASTLSRLLISALENTTKQMVFCEGIIDNNPRYAESVDIASTFAVTEQITLTEMLAQRDNLRAAQVNLNTMQNRLQRAKDKAAGNQYHLMQEALLQYQQFNQMGEHILQNAQVGNNHVSEIEELSIQVLTGYLETLDSLSQQVPQEYQSSIESCRQVTLQFQNRAQYRYQHQGESNSDSQSPTPGHSNGFGTGQNDRSAPQHQGEANNFDNDTLNTSPDITPSPDSGESKQSSSGTSSVENPGSGSGIGPGGSTSSSNGAGSGGETESGGAGSKGSS